MTKVENIITKEVFETMCIMHIQRYHDLLIMNVDTNLMGNVKYIEGYNKDTQKKNIDCNSFRRLSRGKLLEFPYFYPHPLDFSNILVNNFQKMPKYKESFPSL